MSTASTGYALIGPVARSSSSMRASMRLLGPARAVESPDIPAICLLVTCEGPSIVRFQIHDEKDARWRVPEFIHGKRRTRTTDWTESGMSVTVNEEGLYVARASDPENFLWGSSWKDVVFKDQYLEISSEVPSDANIYGLGENVNRLRRNPEETLVTIFARDEGSTPGVNLYGCQPMHLELRNGKAHGVFLNSSNAMDVEIRNSKIAYKVTGGILDFWVYSGPDAHSVVEQHTDVVGKPFEVPYWSLGFHQCRWGYKSVDELREVLSGYEKASIPLDVIWTDIDYMDQYKAFTLDPVNFSETAMTAFLAELHDREQKLIQIVDPGIKVESNYRAYERGKELDLWLKTEDGRDFVGKCWPGRVVWPDWFHPSSAEYYKETFRDWFEKVPMAGVWVDMQEIANFCDGESTDDPSWPNPPFTSDAWDPPAQEIFADEARQAFFYYDVLREVPNDAVDTPNPATVGRLKDNLDDTPFLPNNGGKREYLDRKTVAMSAKHYGGILEYNVHNLYGHMTAMITFDLLKELRPLERPFVLMRSNYAGSGRVGAHWLGDNASTWASLKYSVAGVINYQLFGQPMVGADIGGFFDNATEELLTRWMQLGSFYPFARNHNGLGCISQEPYLYESTSAASKKYLALRYSLLPYYYNLLRKAHEKGTPVWNALWMCFPDDPATYSIDEQFMVGEAFMVSPVLDEGREEVEAYLPLGSGGERWFEWGTGEEMVVPRSQGNGSTVTLPAPLPEIPVHMRGGFILALQQPGTTTESSRRGTFELVIALDSEGCAQGELFLDDGINPETQVGVNATLIKFVYKDGKLNSTGTYGDDGRSDHLRVSKVRVFGLRHTNILGSNSPNSEIKVTFDVASGEQATVSSVEWDLLKGVAEVNLANAPLVSDWNIDLHLGVERVARVN